MQSDQSQIAQVNVPLSLTAPVSDSCDYELGFSGALHYISSHSVAAYLRGRAVVGRGSFKKQKLSLYFFLSQMNVMTL